MCDVALATCLVNVSAKGQRSPRGSQGQGQFRSTTSSWQDVPLASEMLTP